MMERITIVGTGLLGTSAGLALRAAGFKGEILGCNRGPEQLATAAKMGAVTPAKSVEEAAAASDVTVLAGPVLSILDWMERLSPVLKEGQLLTDVGSTKTVITEAGERLYNQPDRAAFLPGHPMAGKEVSGAVNAEAALFNGAMWLFTPAREIPNATAAEWREWVHRFGSRTLDLDAARHDEIVAWVSHMPQFLSTALSALLQEHFGDAEDMRAIGGRALREMTRLGSSPYSMWRDIAHTNTDAVTKAIHGLEQELAHLRDNLTTPELRTMFDEANQFRIPRPEEKK
jgi:prephenate dehydrogenase